MELSWVVWVALMIQAVVFGAFCSYIASEKNRNPDSWFFVGFFFSLLAVLALIAVPKLDEPTQEVEKNDVISKLEKLDKEKMALIKCPSCGAQTSINADGSCSQCKNIVFNTDSPESVATKSYSTEQTKTKRKCPFCAEEINIDAVKCKHCGEFLTEALREESKKYEKQTASSTKTIRMFITVIIAGVVISGLIKSCADIYFATH